MLYALQLVSALQALKLGFGVCVGTPSVSPRLTPPLPFMVEYLAHTYNPYFQNKHPPPTKP